MSAHLSSEAQERADFSMIRYGQVWEDADVLLEALDIQPGDHCLTIASAGDNALALLTKNPARVVALDLNPAQLHCLALRVAAFLSLEYVELLELIGSRPSKRRAVLYQKCRKALDADAILFWDSHSKEIEQGIGHAGKFERYFKLFRDRILPLIHSKRKVLELMTPKSLEERMHYYNKHWNTCRWHLLFKLFFSRTLMGLMGRDPAFFRYVEGDVANRILERTRHALTHLNCSINPYLHWILLGTHGEKLPFYLREENFESIRANLDRLEWHCASVEEYESRYAGFFHRFNLSDIFEYMSPDRYHILLERLHALARPGGRLVYWNMLVPRSRPEHFSDRLQPLDFLANELFLKDQAFFYSALVVEEVT